MNAFINGASTSRAIVIGHAIFKSPLGCSRRLSSTSAPSRSTRSARRQVCKYSRPESVSVIPRELRRPSETPKDLSSRDKDRLTVDGGTPSSFAAALRVPASAAAAKVRTSFKSGTLTRPLPLQRIRFCSCAKLICSSGCFDRPGWCVSSAKRDQRKQSAGRPKRGEA